MQMMREYYATPNEDASGSFHRCTYIGSDAARAFFEGEVDELPDERGAYSATEAAEILGVSRMRVNQLLNEGRLDGRKVGHAWQVYRYSVENRLRESEEGWKNEAYATMDDFIGQAILPTLGDFADDYDLEGIADEIVEFDGRSFRWKREYVDDIDAYNEVCQRHDRSAADDDE